MEMVNCNNTILANIPIVSHTLLVEIFMDEFSRGQKLGKFKGFISPNAVFQKILWEKFL